MKNAKGKPINRILFFCAAFVLALDLVLMFGGNFSQAKELAEKEICSYKYFTSIEVQKGDSLNTIASAYMNSNYNSADSYIEEVKHMNGLQDDIIHAGRFLVIPYYSTELKDS